MAVTKPFDVDVAARGGEKDGRVDPRRHRIEVRTEPSVLPFCFQLATRELAPSVQEAVLAGHVGTVKAEQLLGT